MASPPAELPMTTPNSDLQTTQIELYKTYRFARVKPWSVKTIGTRLEFSLDLTAAESVTFDNSKVAVVHHEDPKPDAVRAYREFENDDEGRSQLREFRDYAENLAATGADCYVQGWIASPSVKQRTTPDFCFGCIA